MRSRVVVCAALVVASQLAHLRRASADECPDLAAYEHALAARRAEVAQTCTGKDTPECDELSATILAIRSALDACLDGQPIGPPRSEWLTPETAIPSNRLPRFDGFFEGLIGGSLPIANDVWRSSAGPSPTASAHFGLFTPLHVGPMVSVEWLPENLQPSGLVFDPPVGAFAYGMTRLRFLGHVFVEHSPWSRIRLDARVGAGVELDSYTFDTPSTPAFPSAFHNNITATDFALEIGAGGWYAIHDVIELGAQLEMPIAIANGSMLVADGPNPTFLFIPKATYDLELVVGVRIGMRKRSSLQ